MTKKICPNCGTENKGLDLVETQGIYMSTPAPASRPAFKASAKALLSTIGPRAVLIKIAWGCIKANFS